jgi:hypothetical protein
MVRMFSLTPKHVLSTSSSVTGNAHVGIPSVTGNAHVGIPSPSGMSQTVLLPTHRIAM